MSAANHFLGYWMIEHRIGLIHLRSISSGVSVVRSAYSSKMHASSFRIGHFFIAPKGVSNLLQNKPQVWFKWTEVTSIHFWTLCDTDGDAIMQELEGSHWYSGALCMCWVVDWPTRLNTTFVFSSFWLDWHKARTSKILDNQTKRTKSDGEPTKEYTRPGENWYAEDIFGKWFQGQCEANRSLHNCKFIDLDILI